MKYVHDWSQNSTNFKSWQPTMKAAGHLMQLKLTKFLAILQILLEISQRLEASTIWYVLLLIQHFFFKMQDF